MRLNHLHLRVRDVTRSLGFYRRFVRLREHVRHGDVVFLTDDARFDLALAPADEVERFPPWFHFGFRLESPERVRSLYREMSDEGATLTIELDEEETVVSFRCADPDGYTIDVYWE